MKVGILTFHGAHNFGAVLQAFALKKYVEKNFGYEVNIINYNNKKLKKRYRKKLGLNISLKDFIYPKNILNQVRFVSKRKFMQPSWSKQWEKFEEFINKYLVENSAPIKKNQFDFNKYDILIVGSDQIWESWITNGLDSVYLLDFDFDGIKMAYAASRASDSFKIKEKIKIKKCIEKFDYVSVRENKLQKSLQCFIDKKIDTVLDPTLLLDGIDYFEIMSEKLPKKKNFIFVYFVKEDSKMQTFVNQLSKELSIDKIEFHYYYEKDRDDQVCDIGPKEFLRYIYEAEYVVTNSFHGTVFSILFNKNFYSYYNTNMRIDNLLCQLDLKNRNVKDDNIFSLEKIDYERVNHKMNIIRKKSYIFLQKALENRERAEG